MFIIETSNNSTVITTGETKHNSLVGPGGFSAKTWKTEAAAAKFSARWDARPGFAFVRKIEG
ncbi:MAG TPA: hypothetical protein VJ692_15105 [Nitrospiraceae bacterium]|nr:hypothetical protein [Nitrospiraceae bacterium]